ncbi:ComEC/Rec2 family competence protein [Nodosilinea sp. P-1105]|uniref:ComEC/Rec2 family competence protein n=1 Tax=Nodosilinea sp. P-1105 TaxID=2546229 RepID=UPI00146BAF55|nr:ComEC/Rec2 family competence protein [Nodosilinea sp. P-1105]NMF86179.1 ComEC/Rec2 family competence protein [Nodosilinea sp. P-1105]
MNAIAAWLWCSAYGATLVVAGVLVRAVGLDLWTGVALAAGIALGAGGLAALLLPRWWRTGPSATLWWLAGMIGLVAALNYGWRYPGPGALDVSRLLTQGAAAGVQQEVGGWVEAMPRVTRSGGGQFWLQADQLKRLDDNGLPLRAPETVTGKLYVTTSAEAIEGLFPGQRVQVRGQLYAPSVPKNPNAFDFRQYLADQRSYAGLRGQWVRLEPDGAPAWWRPWRLRSRIAQAHQASLGDRAGPLVSAMALGRRAVQVPYDIQDNFVQAGMAHTLAASGFHVSLVLGVVLAVMGHPAIAAGQTNPAQTKLLVGLGTLGGYILLTGGQPSVMRAALMGVGALVGLTLERKTNPIGCLLLAVTLLLLVNPTWVDDVGFRLSVVATLGLVVSVKPITARLEWLPTTLATLAAVPIAAYIWCIPLSLYYFNTLTTYSILLNMVATPLVMVISLGGLVSGLVALISPGISSFLAWFLALPTHLLMELVQWQVGLPGSAVATGHINLGQLFGLYGLYWLGGWQRWWMRRRWLVGLLLLLLALGPLWYRGATLTQVTVLAAGRDAVMVVQDRRSPLLINSGTQRTGFYTVAPFLRQGGINRLDYGVSGADSDRDNWRTIADTTPVRRFYGQEAVAAGIQRIRAVHPLAPGQPQRLGRQQVVSLDDGAGGLRLDLFGHGWVLLPRLSLADQQALVSQSSTLASEVLWWHGEPLAAALLAAVQPQVAIVAGATLDPTTAQQLLAQGVTVFVSDRDGAINWTPRQGYQAYLATRHRSPVGLD